MSACLSFLGLFFLFLVFSLHGNTPDSHDANKSAPRNEIIRVIQPGVFDIQSQDFLVRMRAWGVEFPKRGQLGYEAALAFTEKKLISTVPSISIKKEFDDLNLKVVDIELFDQKVNFSKEAILLGIGWHNEKETGRFGPYLMAQLKAKRLKTGIWSTGFSISSTIGSASPQPKLPTLYDRRQGFIPSLSFWVTSFGKIHRPGCSFYERGRGTLTSKPTGTDCRICGGRYPKK